MAGFHGALLAGALADGRRVWRRGTPGLVCTGLLLIAATLSHASVWGSASYLAVPVAVGIFTFRDQARGDLGLPLRWDPGAVALGLAVGLFLGVHLLISASRTLGYQIRLSPLAPILAALAYDAGANVCSAECFFRGALFGRWQRRWGFWRAAGAATGLSVIRYLFDPALPRSIEVVTGVVFYLSLLGLSGCALVWWSGSLLPSAAASLAFFSAYRTLAGW